jgi:hypothetical protein
MRADIGAFGHQLDRLEVLVAKDVEGTHNHAGSTANAQAACHDLVEQVLPLGLLGNGHDGA